MGRTSSETNIQKNMECQVQWYIPIVPATGDAEVSGLLEPRSARLQRAMIPPLHFTTASATERDPVSGKKKKKGGRGKYFRKTLLCSNIDKMKLK